MASKLSFRGLIRPRIVTPTAATTPLLLASPGVSLTAARYATAVHGGGGAVDSMHRNWMINRSVKKVYKKVSKDPREAAKPKRPAPGERKAFRKRIVLSNNSALAVEGLPELEADTLLRSPPEEDDFIHATDGLSDMLGGTRQQTQTMHNGEPMSSTSPNSPVMTPTTTTTTMTTTRGCRALVALPDDLVDRLRVVEAFKPTQTWNLFRHPHFLVRRESVELARKMRGAADAKRVLRLVVDGRPATGKSMLLLQAMAHALANNWIVINLPEGYDLINGNTDYMPVPDTQPRLFSQPGYVTKLMAGLHEAHEPILRSLTVTRRYRTELINIAETATLADVCLSVREREQAWPTFQVLWHELSAVPGRPPILLSLDGLVHVNVVSDYFDQAYRPIHAHELALPRLFVDSLAGIVSRPFSNPASSSSASSAPAAVSSSPPATGAFVEMPRVTQAFVNGGAVLATAGGNNSPRHPALKLALERAHARARGEDPPAPDPYQRRYDDRVLAALADVEVLHVGGLDRRDTRSVMEYWAASGILRQAVTEAAVTEKWTLGGNGVFGELERVTLHTMRM